MSGSIRVFVLDDHELVRRGFINFLEDEKDFVVVGEAETGNEALDGIKEQRPDIAILDIRLPDMSGIEVCRQVKARWPRVRCVMLTSFGDDQARLDALLAGADGYVLKDTKTADLVRDLRRLAEGALLIDPGEIGAILARMGDQDAADALETLSPQERNILGLVGAGLSNREIADRLHLAEQTVKNYVSRLLAKLKVERRTQAALLAARAGGAVADQHRKVT